MKWILLRWLAALMAVGGLLMAGGDGPLFPWTNLAGVALIVAGMAALRRDPDYLRLAREG